MRAIRLLLFVAVFIPSVANADLISRLQGQAVYDTDLNITWIANANLAATHHFGLDPNDPSTLINADGTMDWYVAYYDCLPALNADGGTGYLGFNDWRLPATLQPDFTCSAQFPADQGSVGSFCTGSEMGHLFYEELGGTNGVSILNSADPDLALFQNLQAIGNVLGIWSDSCCIIPPGGAFNDFAYYFYFDSGTGSGQQAAGPKLNQMGFGFPGRCEMETSLRCPNPVCSASVSSGSRHCVWRGEARAARVLSNLIGLIRLWAGEAADLDVATAANQRDRRGKENLTPSDIRWSAETNPAGLLAGFAESRGMASPTVPSWNQLAGFLQSMRRLSGSSGFAA